MVVVDEVHFFFHRKTCKDTDIFEAFTCKVFAIEAIHPQICGPRLVLDDRIDCNVLTTLQTYLFPHLRAAATPPPAPFPIAHNRFVWVLDLRNPSFPSIDELISGVVSVTAFLAEPVILCAKEKLCPTSIRSVIRSLPLTLTSTTTLATLSVVAQAQGG